MILCLTLNFRSVCERWVFLVLVNIDAEFRLA